MPIIADDAIIWGNASGGVYASGKGADISIRRAVIGANGGPGASAANGAIIDARGAKFLNNAGPAIIDHSSLVPAQQQDTLAQQASKNGESFLEKVKVETASGLLVETAKTLAVGAVTATLIALKP